MFHQNNIGTVGSASFALTGLTVDPGSTSDTVNAECNWWGSSTGPLAVSNPGGTGEEVVGDADFNPWLTAPAPGGPCFGGVPSTPGKVTGGGQVQGDPLFSPFGDLISLPALVPSVAGPQSQATFGFTVRCCAPAGNLEYNDHGANVRIKSQSITGLFIGSGRLRSEHARDVHRHGLGDAVDRHDDAGLPGRCRRLRRARDDGHVRDQDLRGATVLARSEHVGRRKHPDPQVVRRAKGRASVRPFVLHHYAAAMPSFAELLAERPVLLADGATGTNYQDMGIEPGVAPEEWVFDAPERVRGAASPLRRGGLRPRAHVQLRRDDPAARGRAARRRTLEVNIRAAELARSAVGDEGLVAGSMGPTGQLVEPYGLLTREVCVEAYAEQAQALKRRRRRPARARDVLRARGGALGDRRRAERDRPAARRIVQLRSGNADDDGAQPHRRRRGRRAARGRRARRELRPVTRGHRRDRDGDACRLVRSPALDQAECRSAEDRRRRCRLRGRSGNARRDTFAATRTREPASWAAAAAARPRTSPRLPARWRVRRSRRRRTRRLLP